MTYREFTNELFRFYNDRNGDLDLLDVQQDIENDNLYEFIDGLVEHDMPKNFSSVFEWYAKDPMRIYYAEAESKELGVENNPSGQKNIVLDSLNGGMYNYLTEGYRNYLDQLNQEIEDDPSFLELAFVTWKNKQKEKAQ